MLITNSFPVSLAHAQSPNKEYLKGVVILLAIA